MTAIKDILAKAFDCTLGALWRLYVKIIVDNIFVIEYDLDFVGWVFAIVVTALFICAIPVVIMILLHLVIVAMLSIAGYMRHHWHCNCLHIAMACIEELQEL